jgi:hypothetical protein
VLEKLERNLFVLPAQEAKGNEGTRVVESNSQELAIVPEQFHDVAGFRRSLDGLDLITEDPLVPAKESALFVFLEDEFVVHDLMVDRIASRIKKPPCSDSLRLFPNGTFDILASGVRSGHSRRHMTRCTPE